MLLGRRRRVFVSCRVFVVSLSCLCRLSIVVFLSRCVLCRLSFDSYFGVDALCSDYFAVETLPSSKIFVVALFVAWATTRCSLSF